MRGERRERKVRNRLLICKLVMSQSRIICNQYFLTSLVLKSQGTQILPFYFSELFFIIVNIILRQVVPLGSKVDLSSSRFTLSRFHIERKVSCLIFISTVLGLTVPQPSVKYICIFESTTDTNSLWCSSFEI